MKLTVKLEGRAAVDRQLSRLVSAVENKLPLFKTWAAKVVRQARRNALKRSKGGRFWKSIADLTRIASVSLSGATIVCDHFAGAHKETGGPIRPKNGSALTIPIHRMAMGKRVGELRLAGVEIFRLPGTRVLGYVPGKKGQFVGLYVLSKGVTQQPEPWWPTAAETIDMGVEEATWHIKKEMGTA